VSAQPAEIRFAAIHCSSSTPKASRSNHELAINTLVCGTVLVAALDMRWIWVNQAPSE
jgi:hypothetical protein